MAIKLLQQHRESPCIVPGLPTIPKRLVEKMHRLEYTELAELLPTNTTHDATLLDAEAQRFAFFLQGYPAQVPPSGKRFAVDTVFYNLCGSNGPTVPRGGWGYDSIPTANCQSQPTVRWLILEIV